MENHSVNFFDAPKTGHLHAFLSRQLIAMDSCPNSEFESRFNIFVMGFEEIFRNREREREMESGSHDIDEAEVDRTMYAELIGIFRHALARTLSDDIYFARKIVFLLSHRFSEKYPAGVADDLPL